MCGDFDSNSLSGNFPYEEIRNMQDECVSRVTLILEIIANESETVLCNQ